MPLCRIKWPKPALTWAQMVVQKTHVHRRYQRSLNIAPAREIEIIELVAEGLTNQEIADRLTINKRRWTTT